MNKVIPTKAKLLEIKSQLAFAKKGYELLDKKRIVLIKEMMDLNRYATKLQDEIEKSFEKSYTSLTEAIITMGSENLREISEAIEIEKDYEIVSTSVMGVEIPRIKYSRERQKPEYSMYKSTSAFDRSTLDLNELKYKIYELAEVENSVFRLAEEIKKTVKRANALDKIQIPKYEGIKREIENILEEKEREDFFRLKKVKDKKNIVDTKL